MSLLYMSDFMTQNGFDLVFVQLLKKACGDRQSRVIKCQANGKCVRSRFWYDIYSRYRNSRASRKSACHIVTERGIIWADENPAHVCNYLICFSHVQPRTFRPQCLQNVTSGLFSP